MTRAVLKDYGEDVWSRGDSLPSVNVSDRYRVNGVGAYVICVIEDVHGRCYGVLFAGDFRLVVIFKN